MRWLNEADPRYLFPFVCFQCRKSFKRPAVPFKWQRPCPLCKGPAIQLSRKFRPPKSTDDSQWEKVRLLVDSGFRFQSIYDGDRVACVVPYPKTLADARHWVKKWRHKVKDATKQNINT